MDPPFPCPVCGHLVFADPPGSHDLCPICAWEDDVSQLRFAETTGANRVSLLQAQRNYAELGASDLALIRQCRPSRTGDAKDPEWFAAPAQHLAEQPTRGIEQGQTYPADQRSLYYWRRKPGG